jgi:hypothetical protein
VPATVGVTVSEPLVFCAPLQLPEAVQLVTLNAAQVSVVELPTVTVEAASVSAGGPGGSEARAASA